MEVYGNQQHVGRFTKLMEAWMNLGEPKYTDYHVELICPAAADDTSSHSYLDKRPNATLRFSLNEV
ncbi:hypothetical protein F4055_17870 [Candidatus Poribacteria bacterium]|nr:hypothetical protein [Candidatus Poribacteria bacterium]